MERSTSTWRIGRAVSEKESWGMFLTKCFSVWRFYICQNQKKREKGREKGGTDLLENT